MENTLEPFEKLIMLLMMTEKIINKRRYFEQTCGYPEDYGNDHILIKAITKHLNSPEIKPIVARVREIMDMQDAHNKREKHEKN